MRRVGGRCGGGIVGLGKQGKKNEEVRGGRELRCEGWMRRGTVSDKWGKKTNES